MKSVDRKELLADAMADMGNEFRRIRKEKKIGLQEAADRLGLSFGYLARLERAEQKLTSQQIEAFASLYGLPAKELLERAGLASSHTQYLPVESIQHAVSYVTKNPSLQGSIYVPTSLEGKSFTVCLFQALFERQLLSPEENQVTLEWIGFSSLTELRFTYLGPTIENTSVLQQRGSSEEALEDVRQVLKGVPQWGMVRWMPREPLPSIAPYSQKKSEEVEQEKVWLAKHEARLRLEGTKEFISQLNDSETFLEVMQTMRDHNRTVAHQLPLPDQISLFHMGEAIEEEIEKREGKNK